MLKSQCRRAVACFGPHVADQILTYAVFSHIVTSPKLTAWSSATRGNSGCGVGSQVSKWRCLEGQRLFPGLVLFRER